MPDQDSIKKPILQGEDHWEELDPPLSEADRMRIILKQNDPYPEGDPEDHRPR